jgi:hypothetical protein
MYVAEPSLPLPSDDQQVWRYLDFAKFVAMLDSSELYLARADTFVDPFELAIPRLDVAAAREAALTLLRGGAAAREGVIAYLAYHGERAADDLRELPDERLGRELLRLTNHSLYVSCWHMNDDESAAMWTVYLNGREGVALQTTVGALRAELDAGSADTPVYVGAITYLDYQRQSWGQYRPFNAVMHKRRSFAHEQELRAVVVRPTWSELADYAEHPDRLPSQTGVGIPVNLDRLIQRVVVSPRAREWYVNLVASMLHRFGCGRTPVQSDLYTTPSF